MKFYVTSDLHIDAYSIRRDFWNDFDKDAVLIIAGDVSNSLSGFNYVEHVLCKHFRVVIAIAGNHEWYSKKNLSARINSSTFRKEYITNPSYTRVMKNSPISKLKRHSAEIENFIFLDNEAVEIDGFKIYGGTLWFPIHEYSDVQVSDYALLMNDLKFINHRIIEEQHKSFINNLPHRVDLVISHHLPNIEAFAKSENITNAYTDFYHASLSDELVARARFWVAGHQHDSVEKQIANGNTTFISNPKGPIPMHQGLLKNKLYYL
ncbi:metallophosphoesterase [Vibrio viridaestus]|uniref:Serine/threonine protein phosphatase n=1 Tax=Vibrio viridaestus TaxID=2487322 RepID=A0A3N9TAM0_9VIBR|nr:metallophosphoesterase [Vibrio viridaestus]RQW61171.1 serine/threonine protein phosphatase [Vibrio viridaestus]